MVLMQKHLMTRRAFIQISALLVMLMRILQGKPMEVRLSNMVAAKGVLQHQLYHVFALKKCHSNQ
jgi:hypothetical protein